jgi:hypothetical protein
MKQIVTATILAITSLSFYSCNKNVSEDVLVAIPEPKLESAIYPAITKPGLMVIGTEQSICTTGDNITLFVPYEVVSEDIQEATITIKDAATGVILKEVPMNFSTDISVLNVTVPEELQGQLFLFSNLNLDTEFTGKTVTVSTNIKATLLRSTNTLENAFQIQ